MAMRVSSKPLKTYYQAGLDYLDNSEYGEGEKIGSTILGLEEVYDIHDDPDVILFMGGTDISPHLYGEKPLSTTQKSNIERDAKEVYDYNMGLELGTVNVGICRGAQLLNVMNGGKLWQHVTDHRGNHPVTVRGPDKYQHYIQTLSSDHHQLIIPPRNGNEKHNPFTIVAEASVKPKHWFNNAKERNVPRVEVEGIWFPNTQSLGVQWHPGWDDPSAKALHDLWKWYVEKLVVSCVA